MESDPVLGIEQTKRLIAMGQMAASLAHELRNPLGSMELYCTLLKKDGVLWNQYNIPALEDNILFQFPALFNIPVSEWN